MPFTLAHLIKTSIYDPSQWFTTQPIFFKFSTNSTVANVDSYINNKTYYLENAVQGITAQIFNDTLITKTYINMWPNNRRWWYLLFTHDPIG